MQIISTVFRIFVCFSALDQAWTDLTPLVVNRAEERVADCNGHCEGDYATWTGWGECFDGECHLNYGKQKRQTDCYVMVTSPPSRGDAKDQEPIRNWVRSCREVQVRECIQELTCNGIWGKWGSWTACEQLDSDAQCGRRRRRFCVDLKNARLPGSHCYGGAANDTDYVDCRKKACFREQGLDEDLDTDQTIQPMKTKSDEKSDVGLNQNTMLIIAVAVGSLVFGALFVLLLLNLVRRSSGRDSDSSSSNGDRWKRIGSTTTSSTCYSAGYVAAGDVLSPRPELRDIQSPSTSTTGSGSSAGFQMQFFGRGEVRPQNEFAPMAPLLTVSGGVSAVPGEERPRRSRLLQENIYWEIKDKSDRPCSVSTSESAEMQLPIDEGLDSTEEGRELVDNVLYSTRVSLET